MVNAIVDTSIQKRLRALGQLYGAKFKAEYGIGGVKGVEGPWTAMTIEFVHNGKKVGNVIKTRRWPANRQEADQFVNAAVGALVGWANAYKKGLPDVQ